MNPLSRSAFALWPFPVYYVLAYLKNSIVNAIFFLVFLYYIQYIYFAKRKA